MSIPSVTASSTNMATNRRYHSYWTRKSHDLPFFADLKRRGNGGCQIHSLPRTKMFWSQPIDPGWHECYGKKTREPTQQRFRHFWKVLRVSERLLVQRKHKQKSRVEIGLPPAHFIPLRIWCLFPLLNPGQQIANDILHNGLSFFGTLR